MTLNPQSLGRPVRFAELATFYSYAIRIKSITHRHRRPIDPLLLCLLEATCFAGDVYLLPKLTSVQIGVSSWDTLSMAMGLSPELRHLALDLGFTKARTNAAVAAEYLDKVAHIASLQRLDLRGMPLSHERIDSALISMKSLRALSLKTGKSLTVYTLAAIAAFPCLDELEIHAGHIDADELADLTTIHEMPLFPSLQMLHIRAQAPLVELVLQKMPSGNLRRLIIEAEQPPMPPLAWASAFSLIPTKAANSLRELTIEHHADSIIERNSNEISTPPQLNSSKSINQFTVATLYPLAKLPNLRKLVLDTTVCPDLCDADIEEVAKWWPQIEHLDLGGLLWDVDCLGYTRKLRASLRCLDILSRLCPRLETLVINLDISFECVRDAEPRLSSHILRSLTIGSISAPEPPRLSQYLSTVFPSLIKVDGVVAYQEEWLVVQSMLKFGVEA